MVISRTAPQVSVILASIVAAIAAAFLPALAAKEGREAVEACIFASLMGPQAKDLRMFGHSWNCQEADIREMWDGSIRVRGRIDRRLSGRGDVETYYLFYLEPDGRVLRVESLGGSDGLFINPNYAGAFRGFSFDSMGSINAWRTERNRLLERGVIPEVLPPLRSIAAEVAAARFFAERGNGLGWEWLIDRPGGTIGVTIGGTTAQCEQQCANRTACVAWSWRRPVDGQPSSCSIKNDRRADELRFDRNTISGAKPQTQNFTPIEGLTPTTGRNERNRPQP
ncbi:MAG: PAN domain-containing protein [Pseudomonadota bacterium]